MRIDLEPTNRYQFFSGEPPLWLVIQTIKELANTYTVHIDGDRHAIQFKRDVRT